MCVDLDFRLPLALRSLESIHLWTSILSSDINLKQSRLEALERGSVRGVQGMAARERDTRQPWAPNINLNFQQRRIEVVERGSVFAVEGMAARGKQQFEA